MKQYNYGLHSVADGTMFDNLNILVAHGYLGDGSTMTITDEGDGYHFYLGGHEEGALSYTITRERMLRYLETAGADTPIIYWSVLNYMAKKAKEG